MLAPRPDRGLPGVAAGIGVCGEWRRASGLGEGARLMHAGLESLGVPSWLVDAAPYLPGLQETAQHASRLTPCPIDGERDAMPPAGAPLVVHVNAPSLPDALRRLPRGALRGRRIIGYWAWELPAVPPAWREGTRFVHEIWAPSHFTAAALESLAPGRVRVVPHPVAVAPPVASRLTRADFGLADDAFVVLTAFSLASSFERKNPLAAIAAFRAAFGDSARHRLILKLAHTEHWPADLRRLQAGIAGCGNIQMDTRTLPRGDLHALTLCADAVLSLHRSEGFGLVPAEAMLLGRPVVATDWSATAEFITPECGMPVAYTLVPAVDPRGVFEAPGAVWAEADVGAAAAALRRLAGEPGLALSLGEAARRAAGRLLGTEKLAAAVAALGLPLGARRSA